MKRKIFILVPSPHPTGPVKGAYALANALVSDRQVTMVFLRGGPGVDAPLDQRVNILSLAGEANSWLSKMKLYRRILNAAGGRSQVASISMCFSADMVNRNCRQHAVICASIRGNLVQNYRHDYGWWGIFLALVHIMGVRSFDHVVSMTLSMAQQVRTIALIKSAIIGNFVDEFNLEPYRRSPGIRGGRLRFVFVGSLTRRKRPDLVIEAIQTLVEQGHDVGLDIVGDGPLYAALSGIVVKRRLEDRVYMHGRLRSPYSLIAEADAFVLPSHSEGLSRAAMEALFLGVPCVLRAVDGNSEMLSEKNAGILFSEDAALSRAMLLAAQGQRSRQSTSSLLSPTFGQLLASQQYLQLVESDA